MLRLLPRQETLTLPPVDTGFPEDLRHEGDRTVQATWDRKETEILKEGRVKAIKDQQTSGDKPHSWAVGFMLYQCQLTQSN